MERDARLERLRQAKKEQDEEVARMKAFIDRFRYQATKAAQVQSRIKMLDRVVPIEVPAERKRVRFTFPSCPKSGRTVIELEGVRKAYGTNVVLDDIRLHVERGDRIALVAPNGAGKSTLMRLLAGAEPPDAGARREGHQVVMQYFAQDEATRLEPGRTVYEIMQADSPVGMVPMIRNILGGFLFSGDDIYKRAGVLSGGERTRLAVARMLLRPANTLLLDEPTNHLDLDSKDVLLEALEDFGGTLIFVSHDRYFVDKLATKIIEVGHGTIEVYPGTYEEFLWSRARRQETDSSGPATGVTVTEPGRAAGLGARELPAREARGTARRSAGTARPSDPASRQGVVPSGLPFGRTNPQSPMKKRRRRTLTIVAESGRPMTGPAGLPNSKSESPRGKPKSASSKRRWLQPGFYDAREQAEASVTRHQALMWEVGDLMNQWEALQTQEVSE